MQKFAYWFISTAWDLQVDYRPTEDDEWTIEDRDDLKEKMPEFYQVFLDTVAPIFITSPPKKETLEQLGKKRSELPPLEDEEEYDDEDDEEES
eukprot:CAMPEP_0118689772 /NCGR_PEP_ID=MMETSP0800-20121206/9680_1 /TAXON_ID=210618 ORGANISM="Striatella unipunctata, Strain CCMP2910" /NCGR_SAMPLE_ID=MMETSP0800 /ASSEMBLY_ACC=CAM_ASM_000638 /LENGTH=92 /DNA_ID=CAMNT_0006587217 /DNA_START=18 /DNA_END=295 /DNA_ORIENTATION=+